jgi:hypothetical protein
LVISSFDKEVVMFFTKSMLDEQMTKIKAVYFQKLYNFVVEHILNWINFYNKKYVWISKIWKFEFFIRSLMEKQSKLKL